VVQGPIKVVDHLGNAFVLPTGKETIALCRCGQSSNKPFCDGSHRFCGFQAPETAPPLRGLSDDI
jgi:CDGSH-type Zn-finger protein